MSSAKMTIILSQPQWVNPLTSTLANMATDKSLINHLPNPSYKKQNIHKQARESIIWANDDFI